MRRKSDIKVQIIYQSYRDQGKEKLTFRDGKQVSGHLGSGPNGIIKGDIRKHFGLVEMFYFYIDKLVSWMCTAVKPHQIVQLKCIQLIVHKLYDNSY